MVIFYTDTKSLEQELMKFLVQKGKIPYAWQEALISTSAVSIKYYIYYITCISFAWMRSAVLWKCPCRLLGVIKSYLFYLWLNLINFIDNDFIIGNKRNSAPGMERLSSKNPYRWRISSVSKKESWLYNKLYQFWH